MPRKEYMEKIKDDPEKLAKIIQGRKDYRQRLKNDPVRYEHYKEKHREHGKKRYVKHKDRIREEEKVRRQALNPEKKKEIAIKTKQNRIDRRKNIIIEWGSSCQRCGYSEHPEILEFDHKEPLYR